MSGGTAAAARRGDRQEIGGRPATGVFGRFARGSALSGRSLGTRATRTRHGRFAAPPVHAMAGVGRGEPDCGPFRAAPAIIAAPEPFRFPRHPMAQYVYTMNRVGKIVPPKRVILKDISLSFFPGAKIGVLGLNGSGKSSCCASWPARTRSSRAKRCRCPGCASASCRRSRELDPDKTVRETVEEGLSEILDAKTRLDEIYAAYAEPDADFDKLAAEQAKYEAIIAAAGADTDVQMEIAADALRLPPWDAKVAKLSGGEKRRVALCRLLLSKPDMLLLDEPTNHLDAESVDWLEQFLQRFPGTVIAVTHDRYFLDNAAEWILELDRGYGIPWKGNYSSWLEQKEARLAAEAKQEAARIKAMQKELEWVRQNAKGRQAKSKARIARFEELSSYEHQQRNETQEIFIPVAERLGDAVIEFKDVSKGYGDRLLIDDLSFRVPAGAIVGIIGPNGAGKTTLFRMITGKEKPDNGRDRHRPDGEARGRRPDARIAAQRQDRVGSDLRRTGHPHRRPVRDAVARLPRALQLQGRRPAEDRRHALRRRARPAASRRDAAARAATCCCSTSRRTISTSRRCARSRTRSRSSRAACS